MATRAAVQKSKALRELCRTYTVQAVEGLARIGFHAKGEMTRVGGVLKGKILQAGPDGRPDAGRRGGRGWSAVEKSSAN